MPFKDEGYAKHRTALHLPTKQVQRVTKEVGLYPAMGEPDLSAIVSTVTNPHFKIVLPPAR